MIKISFLAFGLACLLGSCNRENLKYDKPHFDFDSLVQTQSHLLTQTKARVSKESKVNGRSDSVTFMPDSTQWKNELDAFQQLDIINKPMYKGTYQISESDDEHSNLRMRSYVAKIKSPVQAVKFYYRNDLKELKRIESSFEEENLMMTITRKLILEFDEHHGQSVIVRYQVVGSQKMVLSNKVSFSIEGKVSY